MTDVFYCLVPVEINGPGAALTEVLGAVFLKFELQLEFRHYGLKEISLTFPESIATIPVWRRQRQLTMPVPLNEIPREYCYAPGPKQPIRVELWLDEDGRVDLTASAVVIRL